MSTNFKCETKPGADFDVSALLKDNSETCVVNRCKEIMDYARKESCGECVFCREGTLQLFEILNDGTIGKSDSDDLELMEDIAQRVKDNASCEMAVSAATALLDLMKTYPEEFELHFKRKRCTALECKAYYSVHIMPDKCTGCGECLSKCPEGAIAGGEGMIHVIDQNKCTRCDSCIAVCQPLHQAIQKAGAVKPKTPESPVPVGSFEGASGGRRRRRRGSE